MPFRAHKGYYGVDRVQEHSREEVIRDIRPVSSRFFGALLGQGGYAAAFCAALGLMAFEPATAFPVLPLLALLCLCRRVAVSRDILPMRVPQSWKGKDYGDMTPQGSFRRARGMFYIGNDLEANRELWISRDDILTHMLILGTTGSGKTETLVSLAFNYLAVGGGLLYVDPKAAPKLAVQLYTMCRIMGRDDDFLLLSYMVSRAGGSSGKSGLTRTPQHESNTQNPFAVGGANQLTQLLFSLMPGDDDSSGNAIFSSNAQTLISGLMFVLVEMRDRGEIPLSIDVIRRYLMDTEAITKLALRTDLPEKAVLALQAGLATVGWDKNLPLDRQPRAFGDQYGYARAYFGRALSLLVDNYGRIFMTTHGEVDAVDVITGRRIYVTLIPSMDKDPKELRSLGQICLSSVRNACAVGLGSPVCRAGSPTCLALFLRTPARRSESSWTSTRPSRRRVLRSCLPRAAASASRSWWPRRISRASSAPPRRRPSRSSQTARSKSSCARRTRTRPSSLSGPLPAEGSSCSPAGSPGAAGKATRTGRTLPCRSSTGFPSVICRSRWKARSRPSRERWCAAEPFTRIRPWT